MRENILLRFNDHQMIDGIMDYSIEIGVPGRYEKHIIGASQTELGMKLIDAFDELFALFGIPEVVERKINEVGEQTLTEKIFVGSDGVRLPVSKFAATAKLAVEAEIYRNGVVVPPENDAERVEQ